MFLNDSKQWIEDLDRAIETIKIELDKLSGKTVLITGHTGLICSTVVDILLRYNATHSIPITIIGAGRSIEKTKARFGTLLDGVVFKYIEYDAEEGSFYSSEKINYIIHGASNATPNRITEKPVETMMANILGVKGLIDFGLAQGVERLLYISSSEVYGEKDNNLPYNEEEYGFIDVLNSRNSYSIAKRATETLCKSYCDEYGFNSVIVRPGHIYGPTASRDDGRVSSLWLYACVDGQDIVMKSDGSQIRSYCYCLDCATAIIKVMLEGIAGEAYNISNKESMVSIKDMALILSKAAGVKLKQEVPSEGERKSFNPMSNSSLYSTKLESLGWKGLFSAEEGFSNTINILKEVI